MGYSTKCYYCRMGFLTGWCNLKVLNACFLSSLLYSCESWINVSLKPVEKSYYVAIKALLSVRLFSPPKLSTTKTEEFFMKLLQERKGMNDDPFLAAFKLAKDNGTALYFFIDKLMENKSNLIQESLRELKRKIDGSKIISYHHLNPTLEKCNLYNLEIPEFVRQNEYYLTQNYFAQCKSRNNLKVV